MLPTWLSPTHCFHTVGLCTLYSPVSVYEDVRALRQFSTPVVLQGTPNHVEYLTQIDVHIN